MRILLMVSVLIILVLVRIDILKNGERTDDLFETFIKATGLVVLGSLTILFLGMGH